MCMCGREGDKNKGKEGEKEKKEWLAGALKDVRKKREKSYFNLNTL